MIEKNEVEKEDDELKEDDRGLKIFKFKILENLLIIMLSLLKFDIILLQKYDLNLQSFKFLVYN